MKRRRSHSILFLCIGNSCRSQMAEGFARARAPEGTFVYSAGTSPCFVHPIAIRVMAEKGVDISGQWSKGLGSIHMKKIDTVVTLCGEADEICPQFPKKIKRIHWPIRDPIRAMGSGSEVLTVFRRVRDDIESRVRDFFGQEEHHRHHL